MNAAAPAHASLWGRPDFDAIAGWIRPGAHVLDLGCGDGSLLRFLYETRNASGYGVEIDDAANARGERCISAAGSRASAWVVPTDEELMIARHVVAVLG